MPRRPFAKWSVLFFAFLSANLAAHGWPDFHSLITTASPAVVRIDAYPKISDTRVAPMPSTPLPETYHDFFEHAPQDGPEGRATGSGFIISEDGYVLTNQHVVEGAGHINVKLEDRRMFDATVVGVDRRSDLALLKIDADDLSVLQFADPDTVKVGQWVVAIGAPFGLDYSASAGIISAIGRSIPSDGGDSYVPFVQSDVATNPGSSGGPLLNLEGRVVGVNSQIFSRPGGGSIGVSFAIPSEVAAAVVQQLRERGQVVRGWLGVYVQSVDESLTVAARATKDYSGAFVAQVLPGSPAAQAGIEAGDIVISVDGQAIREPVDLPRVTGMLMPGSRVSVELVRDDRPLTLTVIIGQLPDNETSDSEP